MDQRKHSIIASTKIDELNESFKDGFSYEYLREGISDASQYNEIRSVADSHLEEKHDKSQSSLTASKPKKRGGRKHRRRKTKSHELGDDEAEGPAVAALPPSPQRGAAAAEGARPAEGVVLDLADEGHQDDGAFVLPPPAPASPGDPPRVRHKSDGSLEQSAAKARDSVDRLYNQKAMPGEDPRLQRAKSENGAELERPIAVTRVQDPSSATYPLYLTRRGRIQLEMEEHWRRLLKANQEKLLTLEDVAHFTTFLLSIRQRLVEKSDALRRRHTVLRTRLRRAARDKIDALYREMLTVESQEEALHKDVEVFNRLQVDFKASPAYKAMLEFGEKNMVKCSSGEMVLDPNYGMRDDEQATLAELLAEFKMESKKSDSDVGAGQLDGGVAETQIDDGRPSAINPPFGLANMNVTFKTNSSAGASPEGITEVSRSCIGIPDTFPQRIVHSKKSPGIAVCTPQQNESAEQIENSDQQSKKSWSKSSKKKSSTKKSKRKKS